MRKTLHIMNTSKNSTPVESEKILDRAAKFEVPFTLTKEEALARLNEKIANGTKVIEISMPNKHTPLYFIGAVAASLLIIFASWYLFVRKPLLDVVADKGQQKTYQLPDGSEVALNAESKISFEKNSFNQKRNLKLEGEAFFSVKKGKSFTINTELADIKVLGTSFNVFARENSFTVSCVTGKILVTTNTASLIITPGESASVINKELIKSQVKDLGTVACWRSGEFKYENASLTLIFKEIERQYNVTFALPNTDDKFFTGSFSNKNLVDALDIVCIPMELTYEIGSNSRIVIREKP